MKIYTKFFGILLISFISVSLISCNNDEEPQVNGDNTFSFNNETYYFHYQNDYSWPILNYSQREDILQLNFALYKDPSIFSELEYSDIVGGGIEITPFNPVDLKKGDSLQILSRQVGKYSTYTCIESDFEGWTGSQVLKNFYYLFSSGGITFESYDSSSQTVTLRFNKVTFKGNNNDSCVLDGEMKCIYDKNGYLTLYDGVYD